MASLAAIFSVWLAGDRLSMIGWCGGALIVAGMVVAEVWPLLSRNSNPLSAVQPAPPANSRE